MVNILAIISDMMYSSKIDNIINDVIGTNEKILYVSLNKSYKSLLEQFRASNINLNKFIFIDTITASVIDPKPVKNCVYVSSPDNVKDIYSAIIKTVKKENVDALIFDSLSSLTTYKDGKEIIHFMTTLLGSLSLLDCSAVFTCLKSDEDTTLIRHVKMKVDKSYELS